MLGLKLVAKKELEGYKIDKVDSRLKDSLLSLVRLGIGHSVGASLEIEDWRQILVLAMQQGLYAVVLDGVEKLSGQKQPPKEILAEWRNKVLQEYDNQYAQSAQTISEMARFYGGNGFKMMVLNDYACSLNWTSPNHRPCKAIDIWLFGKQKEADATLVREKSISVKRLCHHDTSFKWGKLTVVNRRNLLDNNVCRTSEGFEKGLGEFDSVDSYSVILNGEKVYLPSPDLHVILLLKQISKLFLDGRLSLLQVLDWGFFVEKHKNDVDWEWMSKMLNKMHLNDFFNIINAICVEDLGFGASIFPCVQFNPFLKDKISDDIFKQGIMEKPKGIIQGVVFKYRRWKGSGWKRELC